ncbi:hypothetical protein Taro_047718 [Colocasia esculenta]|uniref:Uncharacterized protein n=1 Tax=Colocasia esculenta TaxID=4460 RepID=A0A843X7D8_COLES|nr:hypothetical protein [Colocasia esculenta]
MGTKATENFSVALLECAPLGFLLTLLIEEGSVHHRLMSVSTTRKWLSTNTILPKPVSGVSTTRKWLSTDSNSQSSVCWFCVYLSTATRWLSTASNSPSYFEVLEDWPVDSYELSIDSRQFFSHK